MDVEKTIQFPVDKAAAHDARFDRLERAVLGLPNTGAFCNLPWSGPQQLLLDTQRLIRDLATQTDQRLAEMTRAMRRVPAR
jgi:hypothetical protein